ncbi:aKG-HExxH-type peptide beta-hydroxylase [Streptomyces cinereoruber]|uniref:aKG-HExxH-type peptide beta-hydroxylase n=1 Tax=Streptomyces cinereoruber TaxID=67260 RepID=UPI00362B3E5D
MTPAPPSAALLGLFARTRPTRDGAALLRSALHARRLVLLKALLVRVRRHRAELGDGVEERFEAAWHLLERAERRAPAAVRDLLDYPTTGGWLAAALTAPPGPEFDARLAHFDALALTAALRAGCALDLTVATPHGTLSLTGLGRLLTGADRVAVRTEGHHARITPEGAGPDRAVLLPRDLGDLGDLNGLNDLGDPRALNDPGEPGDPCDPDDPRGPGDPRVPRHPHPGRPADADPGRSPAAAPHWSPLLRLPGGAAVLDDLDPYRVPRGGIGTPPRTGVEAGPAGRAVWADHWRAALRLLDATDPGRAEEVRRLVRALVPVAHADRGTGPFGATLRAAPGAVLATLPDGPREMAEVLVHETQHTKLAAVHELVPLYTAGPATVHKVGWRTDARPIAGVLQGAYAHLALTDLWRRAARSSGLPAPWRTRAGQQFERFHHQVGRALSVLLESDELTNTGREFARHMRQHHARLGATPRALR